MNEEPLDIHVFGDSHSSLFFEKPFSIGRLGLKIPRKYRIVGKSIPAASVVGFRPGVSTLDVKSVIEAALPSSERMILAFGQVDLELGFYYRKAIKNESIEPIDYVDWLIGIYSDFIIGLTSSKTKIALKGVNLTSLSPKFFAANYVARIVSTETETLQKDKIKLLLPHILSEKEQNLMHLDFNSKLGKFARANSIPYFDINPQISSGDHSDIYPFTARLSDFCRNGLPDHHLADTIFTRKLHFEAAGRAFDLV